MADLAIEIDLKHRNLIAPLWSTTDIWLQVTCTGRSHSPFLYCYRMGWRRPDLAVMDDRDNPFSKGYTQSVVSGYGNTQDDALQNFYANLETLRATHAHLPAGLEPKKKRKPR